MKMKENKFSVKKNKTNSSANLLGVFSRSTTKQCLFLVFGVAPVSLLINSNFKYLNFSKWKNGTNEMVPRINRKQGGSEPLTMKNAT